MDKPTEIATPLTDAETFFAGEAPPTNRVVLASFSKELEQRLAAQERELKGLNDLHDEIVKAFRSQLSQAEADLEHAERNEEEQALTIQILTGRLSQAQALLRRVVGPSFLDNTLQGTIEKFLSEPAQGQGGGDDD